MDLNEKITKVIELLGLLQKEIELPKFLSTLLPTVNLVFGSDVTAYFRREKNSAAFKFMASFPDRHSDNKIINETVNQWQLPDGLIEQTIASKIPLLLESPIQPGSKSIPFFPEHKFKVEIGIPVAPIQATDPACEISDIILSVRSSKERITESEKSIANVLSIVMGTFLHGCFFREISKKQHEQFLMIANAKLDDIDLLFESFLINISSLLPSKFISLWIYNELDDTLALRSFYPSELNGKPITFLSFDRRILDCSKNLTGQAMKSGTPNIFTDIQLSTNNANASFAKRYSLEWLICFPIMGIGHKKLGAINVCPTHKPTEVSNTIIERINRYVSEVASVIRLSTLFFEESLLYAHDEFLEIMLDSHDQKTTWDNLAMLIRDKMHCEACSIFLLEPDNTLRLYGTTGLENEVPYDQARYTQNEPSLTCTAFSQGDPLIYYAEFKAKYTGIHKSKFREKLKSPGRSRSILFVRILNEKKKPIGVIRCNNKEESPAKHIGKFTKEDVIQLEKISRILSNIHIKFLAMRDKEIEREGNVNSLHHEILSPLEGILSHIEWMEEFYMMSDSEIHNRARIKFEDIKQNAKLIEMLVTTMGRFDEDIPLSLSQMSSHVTLQICKSFLFNEAKRNNVKILIEHLGLPKIKADTLQMMRVFYNLIRNAIKYADRNESNKFLSISSDYQSDHVELLFTDNGIGIVAGEEENIFDKFIRGSNARKVFPEGTGLGLAYCRMILKKHKGTIKVLHNSKPTIFQIILPIPIR